MIEDEKKNISLDEYFNNEKNKNNLKDNDNLIVNEMKNILESNFKDDDSQDKGLTSKIKDLYSKNIKNINNYVVSPLIGVASLPLAGLYLAKDKNIGNKLFNTFMGFILTGVLSTGIIKYHENSEIISNTGKVTIENNIRYKSNPYKNTKIEIKDIPMISMFFSNNYMIYNLTKNHPNNYMTELKIKGNDKNDKVFCSYVILNHLGIEDIKKFNIYDKKPDLLEVNGKKIKGNIGVNAYKRLCDQIFEDEKKYL
jgi:hypothetical protein